MATTNGRRSNPTDTTTTMQNAAAATGNGTALTLSPNDREVMLAVTGTTAVLTVVLEASFDGSTYENAFAEDLLAAGGIGTLVGTLTNPSTARYRYRCPPGVTNLRARVSARVSGSVTITGTQRGG